MALILRAHRHHPIRLSGARWRRPFELRHLLLASLILGILFYLLAPSQRRPGAPDPSEPTPWDVR